MAMSTLDLPNLLRDLALDIVAISVLVFGSYYRHYRRWDQVVGYLAFNISLFTVSASLGSAAPLNVGVGFGLFAVLSIVRLRSDEASQVEIGYTMVSLVLGVMAGLSGMDFAVKVVFASLLVLTMFLIDIRGQVLTTRFWRTRIELDAVMRDHDEIVQRVGQLFPGRVVSMTVRQVDLVRDTMTVDVVVDTRQRVAPGE
jgi:hypothetical protein